MGLVLLGKGMGVSVLMCRFRVGLGLLGNPRGFGAREFYGVLGYLTS